MTKKELLAQLNNKLIKLKELRSTTNDTYYLDDLDGTIKDYTVLVNAIKSNKCNTLLDVNVICKYNYPHYFKLNFDTTVPNKSLRELGAKFGSLSNIEYVKDIVIFLMNNSNMYNVVV